MRRRAFRLDLPQAVHEFPGRLLRGRNITTTPEASPATRRTAACSGQPRSLLRHPHHVPQRVLDVHSHQGRNRRVQIAFHQRDVHVLVDVILVAAKPELSVFGVDRLVVHALDRALVLQPVADEIGDGADFQGMHLGEALEVGTPRHRAVVVQIRTIMAAGEKPARRARSIPPRCVRHVSSTPPG